MAYFNSRTLGFYPGVDDRDMADKEISDEDVLDHYEFDSFDDDPFEEIRPHLNKDSGSVTAGDPCHAIDHIRVHPVVNNKFDEEGVEVPHTGEMEEVLDVQPANIHQDHGLEAMEEGGIVKVEKLPEHYELLATFDLASLTHVDEVPTIASLDTREERVADIISQGGVPELPVHELREDGGVQEAADGGHEPPKEKGLLMKSSKREELSKNELQQREEVRRSLKIKGGNVKRSKDCDFGDEVDSASVVGLRYSQFYLGGSESGVASPDSSDSASTWSSASLSRPRSILKSRGENRGSVSQLSQSSSKLDLNDENLLLKNTAQNEMISYNKSPGYSAEADTEHIYAYHHNPSLNNGQRREESQPGDSSNNSINGLKSQDKVLHDARAESTVIDCERLLDEMEADSVPSSKMLMNHVTLCGHPVNIYQTDITSLQGRNHVTEGAVEFYLDVLHQDMDIRARNDVHILSSAIFQTLIDRAEKGNERLIQIKENIFTKKYIILPICHREHWIIAVATRLRN